MVTPTRSRTTLVSSGLIVMNGSAPSVRPFTFTGDGTTSAVTVPEFVKNSTRLVVNGQEWSPDWYTEGKDSDGRWTQILPLYELENGTPCWINYTPAY